MSTTPSTITHLKGPDLPKSLASAITSRRKLLTVFGTRPEAIKLAPVIRHLATCCELFQTVNVTSAQHMHLLYPLIQLFGIHIDYDLRAMEPNQTLNQVCSQVLSSLDRILRVEKPDLILVQGDTTTALAGALAGFHHHIPVAHVEAGLRSGDPHNPYPEEMNRRLITGLATYHFAVTPRNRAALLTEGVPQENVFVTGNPGIDSLNAVLERSVMTDRVAELVKTTEGLSRIILTTHRRESFGGVMAENLRVIRSFIEAHEEVALIFPVHPNPAVAGQAHDILSGHPRIHLIKPLGYEDFVLLLSRAWLIISDSGGVQEEAPTLGKPLLILRKNTERPETVESGVARLVGEGPVRLASMLAEVYEGGGWAEKVKKVENPFGRGDSGKRITRIIAELLGVPTAQS